MTSGWTGRGRSLGLALCMALVMLSALGTGALAQDGPSGIVIREVVLDDDGGTRLVVGLEGSVTSTLTAADFVIREDGEVVESDVVVTPLLESEPEAVSVALLMDVSGSTRGEPLANAQAAAVEFVTALTAQGARVALISFGPQASVLVPLTTDPTALTNAINNLEASGETAVYDAVALAARQLSDTEGQRSVVVFTDGGDTASAATLDQAIAAASFSAIEVTAVSLTTPESDETSLQRLTAETGGALLPVAAASQLSAALVEVAEQIANQYVLGYSSSRTGTELTIEVALAAVPSATDRIVALNPRVPTAAPAADPIPVPPPPSPVIFDGGSGLIVGLAATFSGVLLLLGVAFLGFTPTEGQRLLKRRLGRFDPDADPTQSVAPSTQVSDKVADIIGALPKPAGYEERIQARLDRAAWPIRASEFISLRLGLSAAGLVIGLGLLRNVVITVPLVLVGYFAPYVILSRRITRRRSLFHEQLPDTLQMLASSLRAGYGMLQGLDNVVREGSDPTAAEFGRVLTEARLGVPLEKAMDDMAERLGSEDFRWVVVAISIQRRVGGNLAQLLDTVAATLRERDQVRRQIRVLSAEGRLSGVVLVVMPIAFAIYLLAVQPEYLQPLWDTTVGRVISIVGGTIMVLGTFWMKKLTEIDV